MTTLVTGSAGFIGANLVRHLRITRPEMNIVSLDVLGYAGHEANLRDLDGDDGHVLVRGDIADAELVGEVFAVHDISGVIHLAAESHVDRSIDSPLGFVHSNVHGTAVLLEAARTHWGDRRDVRFHHVSTDEVFGSAKPGGLFSETTPYDPRNPYAATKAAGDHLVRAWHETFGLPTVITNCTNNYGPFQFPEKLIPVTIMNTIERRPIPLYGDGRNIRDWLFVEDHCEAIRRVFEDGADGETYCIGGNSPMSNVELIPKIIDRVDEHLGRAPNTSRGLIEHVDDRPGHDRRYAMDTSKITGDLDWSPQTPLEVGLDATVEWYLSHQAWVAEVGSAEHDDFQRRWYAQREKA